MSKKKLIEVALPLEEINRQSSREKSIRKGHPSTLHLWWARRPLATARAVLFSQLVDDPSERYGEFLEAARAAGEDDPEAAARARVEVERRRLFTLITRMVNWDNIGDEHLLREVREEIRRSTGDDPPAILDPFAGGGSIPLEAQRLGLEAHASDLNPVAVLINKALIEIPPRFAGRPPVFPGADDGTRTWPGAHGLAEDVRRYGEWMREEALRRIGHLYPKAQLPDGGEATVIAWIWARTVTCPNPACGIEMPLVRSWWLGKKKGKEAYIVPTVVGDHIEYSIGHDPKKAPLKSEDGTVNRRGARCLSCGTSIGLQHVRSEGREHRLRTQLIAVACEGHRARNYITADDYVEEIGDLDCDAAWLKQDLPRNPRDFKTPNYGMDTFDRLFTARQLVALTTFSDLVGEAREQVLRDALSTDMVEGERLEEGGSGAAAYADAVVTILGLCTSKMGAFHCTLARWRPDASKTAPAFGRQSIAMVWDFAEVNPFAGAGGDWTGVVGGAADVLKRLSTRHVGEVRQHNASTRSYHGFIVSTDPPYYDNINYGDLSDFFYIWLRRSLREVHPNLLSTMVAPKEEELVANPYRHGGKSGAKKFFESGFLDVFIRARKHADPDYPITVYYAFKQSESINNGRASTGWSTLLEGMINSGWMITATWPMRTENATRLIASGANALASSIVLVLRPRPEDAPIIDRRGLMRELRACLPGAVETLRSGGIAPVDLAQAAIGPGMGVFSRYSHVVGPDGSDMSVAEALVQINAVLDEVLTDQDDDLDPDTRWCLSWYETHGFDEGPYGDAETLASARNASIDALRRSGVLNAGGGRVWLIAPPDLPDDYDPRTDDRISHWEVVLHLARALETGGLDSTGRLLAAARERGLDGDSLRSLAYRLYDLAEKHGRTADGNLFNGLGSSWPEIETTARSATAAGTGARTANQTTLNLEPNQEN
ncbi:DUF1156 domain-containing protein [Actinomyces sp. oral taxon 414]|uniref:DUF1156 domain-containing protein n=1 Tax=Actinomyces sp. oral taxon 414 TaxID=712122 RepID=UPI000A8717EB|nr:DUF1156 domain-containing protein [Actinomyces sp. oral taxon 414]